MKFPRVKEFVGEGLVRDDLPGWRKEWDGLDAELRDWEEVRDEPDASRKEGLQVSVVESGDDRGRGSLIERDPEDVRRGGPGAIRD